MATSIVLELFFSECNIDVDVNNDSSIKKAAEKMNTVFIENSIPITEDYMKELAPIDIKNILLNECEISEELLYLLERTKEFNKIKTMRTISNCLIVLGFLDEGKEILKNRESFEEFSGFKVFSDDIFNSAIENMLEIKYIKESNNNYEITIYGIQYYYVYQYKSSTPTRDILYSKKPDDINKCNTLMQQRDTIVQEKIATLNLFNSYLNEKNRKNEFRINTSIQKNMVIATWATVIISILSVVTTLYMGNIITDYKWHLGCSLFLVIILLILSFVNTLD
ncbi:hypothetical protein [Peptostreptococcus porci]|uniref:hypothetical protein n=1 Tax=Peptostreptococcus porci TaxID=2652282 RepID=UPI002A7F8ED0|nr:hypothetical protein [Peptostreptococcus porci]MDY4128670.1 hypothetical protein [Peptostreptococcus porci]